MRACKHVQITWHWSKVLFFPVLAMYTERKKKRNLKFDIDFQNNHLMYFHNYFTTWKSHQSLILIWEIIILSFESRYKAKGQNAVPHTKSEEKMLSKVWFFF